jgi:hypothetical protein
LASSKRLRGLFIIDKGNLVVLIYDSISGKTDVASVNLATPSVTYKPSLPIIYGMHTGVFASASVYYTVTDTPYFYKDYTSPFVNLNGGKVHGIVYSSDMSSSSCYTMQTSFATGPFILSTFSIS